MENKQENVHNDSHSNEHSEPSQIHPENIQNTENVKLLNEEQHNIKDDAIDKGKSDINHSVEKDDKKITHHKQSSNHENDIKVEVSNSSNQNNKIASNNENNNNTEKNEKDNDKEDKNKPNANHTQNKPSYHENEKKHDEIIIEDPHQNKSNIPEFDYPNMGFSPTQDQYEEMQRQIQMFMDELEITLKSATTLKEAGNKHFSNQDYVQAETSYLKGKKVVDDFNTQYYMIIKSIPPTDKSKTLTEEFFKILSNLSNTYIKQGKNIECIELDKYILTYINPNWDKSYGRLIQACLNLGRLDEANKIYESFKQIKDFDKYKDKHQFVINQLEERNFKNIENLKKSASMPNNQEGQFFNPDSNSISETASQVDIKKRKKKKPSSFGMYAKYFLGGFFLIGGLFSFYFIYRNNFKKMLNSKNN